jgi:hypothetical protein
MAGWLLLLNRPLTVLTPPELRAAFAEVAAAVAAAAGRVADGA